MSVFNGLVQSRGAFFIRQKTRCPIFLKEQQQISVQGIENKRIICFYDCILRHKEFICIIQNKCFRSCIVYSYKN